VKELAGCRVLLVEDDDDSRFLLAAGLARYGAVITEASSGTQALASVAAAPPDVLVSDLQLDGMHGTELMQRLRSQPGLDALPGIALTGHGTQSQRDDAFRAGFSKHLLKPTKTVDLVAAILAIDLRATRDVRALLARLGAKSPCRFTSLLRFTDDDTLSSVWTFDRENPAVDPFPLGLPISASYCVIVRAADATSVIENAATDPRTVGHPKRDELAAYVGVPVRRPDGGLFGTLCSYDAEPVAFGPKVREALEDATREIEATMPWLLDVPRA
jgi:CheY-like chemotaxis protein